MHDEAMDEGPESSRTRSGPRRGGPRGRRDVNRTAADILTVRRVFGEPVRAGDVTLVPVATVLGGSGSGWGSGELGAAGAQESSRGEGYGSGGGGGFGVRVKPVGVYVVQGSTVTWQPSLDLSRVILGGQVVGALALLMIARTLRRRRGRR